MQARVLVGINAEVDRLALAVQQFRQCGDGLPLLGPELLDGGSQSGTVRSGAPGPGFAGVLQQAAVELDEQRVQSLAGGGVGCRG